jgi:hypothetical protein
VAVSGSDQAKVFVDGKEVGTTPYSGNDLSAGAVTLKLVPQDQEKQPYETKVTLEGGVVTVVSWTFGKTADESGGEIMELAKVPNKKRTELSVQTNPNNLIIKVDGQSKGFSPLILTDLSEGQHSVTFSAPGYLERTINPKLMNGYRLKVTAKLPQDMTTADDTTETPVEDQPATDSAEPSDDANTANASPKPSASPKASPKASPAASPKPSASPKATPSTTIKPPYVEILDTGTGWLRVRAEASGSSEELGKLDVGVKVPYAGESKDGWHKVEYETGKFGWVSGKYAEVTKQ